ncbi:MAG: biotin carboxylase N-terminal domain-containing protein [Rickettsiales bacterium]
MFHSILIANRGEIASRIMTTAKRLGMRTIAVYSEADTNALHVKNADEAVYIGASPSIRSYLNVDNLISAIDQSGAEAVHPGYGFLSEKAHFAKAVIERTNAAWVGPTPEAIRLMGDKIESKKIALAAGVSSVPGVLEAISSAKEAQAIAENIGYPVIIKAAAGGGGKGMRIARSAADLMDGMKMATSEAKSSFNDARVFIEKYFDNPRHIEIQVIADKYGNVVSLGERECSIQRRHQKVIEEAPSMFVTPEMREQMSAQAVALAKQVGYQSAGTVEFIVDQSGQFYFLEMNTRLQVEHRVTELVTGIDLVEQMIRIAAGEKLPFTQDDIKINGWAFESRIYAEDPARGFLPSTGRVIKYQEPETKPGTILDTSIYEGGEVSMFYDPMIAKYCTHAPTREQAIDLMVDQLGDFVIQGIAHNTGFLQAVLSHERFRKGDISTNFIEQEWPAGFTGAELSTEAQKVCMAVAVFCSLRDIERGAQISGQLPGRSPAIGARWVITLAGNSVSIYARKKDYGYDISYDDGMIVIRSAWKLGRRLFQGTVNGKPVSVRVSPLAEGYRLNFAGAEVKATLRTLRVAELGQYMPVRETTVSQFEITAPIAGLISAVQVAEGDVIRAGQQLFVIEAMKMENIIYADHDAKVKAVHVKAPASVTAGQLVIEFEEPAKEDAGKKAA